MDLARAGSKREARFFSDAEGTVTIRWYRAPVGAKCFPTVHKWGRLDWYKEPWLAEGVGEVYESKLRYDNGNTPDGVTGQNFYGPLEYFQNGAPYDPGHVTPRLPSGIAEGCGSCEGNFIATQSGTCSFILQEDNSRILLE